MGLSRALVAAQESGLLDALAYGERRTAERWAAAQGTAPRATEVLLEVLVACGIADRTDAGFAGSTALRATFEEGVGGAALMLWTRIGEFLRTGQALAEMDGDAGTRARAYAGVVTSLGVQFERAAARFAEAIPGAQGEVLDVGCGSGVWGLAVAQRWGRTRVTGLDWAEVLPAFERRAAQLGLAERIGLQPGDMHTVDLSVQYDLIVVANVLRLESPARARALLERLALALARGGRLVIVDALAHGSPDRELARSLYGLHLALRTREGRVHTPGAVREWLEAAGLTVGSPLDFGVHVGAVAALVGCRG
ncbi:MAG: class I SAM-dependent methyltransferase [Myxococcales bacterium]|nr:class I SAM-dependent methyltransferase [Myxococcales bacterium]